MEETHLQEKIAQKTVNHLVTRRMGEHDNNKIKIRWSNNIQAKDKPSGNTRYKVFFIKLSHKDDLKRTCRP